jgi:DNA-binding XRE family transcriptional regulator
MSEQTEEAPAPAPKPTIEELRAEIKQTRAELGETVQALAAKADVKARAREQVEVARERAVETVRTNQVPIAAVAVGAMAVVGIILVLRGRRR